MIARISITFIAPFTNFHLFGEQAKRRMYSRVNQVMHTASTMASFGLSIGLPSGSMTIMDGMVFSVNPMVDAMMKEMEMTATT